MTPECLQQPLERKPAIDPEALRLPDGQYANKKSLQEVAYAAGGLPVPEIIGEAEVSQILRARESATPETFP